MALDASTEERLALGISRAEIARVHPWIERLAAQYAIPEPVQFAAGVCLVTYVVFEYALRTPLAESPFGF